MANPYGGDSSLTGGLVCLVGVIDAVKSGKMGRDSQEPECYNEKIKNRPGRQDNNPFRSFHKSDGTFRDNEF
jgi:hypothetical protein